MRTSTGIRERGHYVSEVASIPCILLLIGFFSLRTPFFLSSAAAEVRTGKEGVIDTKKVLHDGTRGEGGEEKP